MMEKDSQSRLREMRYKNFSTAPSYIKIKFRSPETGEILNMIIENTDMSSYLASKHGLKIDKLGRFKNIDAYIKFRETYYFNYMVENEGKVLDIDINDFKKFVSRVRFGNEKVGENYVNSLIFKTPLTLKELGVNNEVEFMEKYFDFSNSGKSTLKEEYYKQYASNPSFIALLIDIDYYVGRGDIVPILIIETPR